jgi:uncharacterized protein YacL
MVRNFEDDLKEYYNITKRGYTYVIVVFIIIICVFGYSEITGLIRSIQAGNAALIFVQAFGIVFGAGVLTLLFVLIKRSVSRIAFEGDKL